MATVKNVKCNRYLDSTGKSNTLLIWDQAVPGVVDILSFTIYRSQSNVLSKYEQMGTTTSNQYKDQQSTLETNLRWYYKITYTVASGESSLEEADVVTSYTFKDSGYQSRLYFVILESMRRLNWVVEDIGEKCDILIRKRAGLRCDCWDKSSKKVQDPNCSICYGVGFVGGYEKLENQRMVIEGGEEIIEESDYGAVPRFSPTGWITNFPLLDENDIIVRADNYRYLVSRIAPKILQNFLIQQHFSLIKLPVSHPIYNF